MRDAAGELADRFQPLRLAELLFERFLFAAIDDEPGELAEPARIVELAHRVDERVDGAAVVVTLERRLAAGDAPPGGELAGEARALLRVLVEQQCGRRHRVGD